MSNDDISRLSRDILELRLIVATAERDIARKELELVQAEHPSFVPPPISYDSPPKMISVLRDFMGTVNGQEFTSSQVFDFARARGVSLRHKDIRTLRERLSRETHDGVLRKTTNGYQRI